MSSSNKNSTMVLFSIFATLSAYAFSANIIPPLITTISKDFGIDYASFGGRVVTVEYLSLAITAFSVGWLSHRLRLTNRFMMITGLLVLGVVVALASTFGSTRSFVIWAIPLGITGNLVITYNSIMLCRIGGAGSSKMLNLGQVFYCVGSLIAPVLAAVVLNYGLSWRICFLSLGAAIFVIGIWFAWQTRNFVETSDTAQASAAGKADNIFRDPLLYLFSGMIFCYTTVETSSSTWLATYFQEYLKLPVDNAASRLGVYWTGMLAGRLLVSALKPRWTMWPTLLIGGVGLLGVNFVMSFNWGYLPATFLIFAGAIFSGPIWPVIVTIVEKTKNSSVFTSIVIGFAALGAMTGPFVSSRLINHMGMRYLFPAISAECLILFIFMLAARLYLNLESRPLQGKANVNFAQQ